MTTPKIRVAIVQECIFAYRYAFFESLRERLHNEGIELSLFYSKPHSDPYVKERLPWAKCVSCMRVGPLFWQSIWKTTQDYDLVIVPQHASHLASIALQFTRKRKQRMHAFWGHGKNLQASFWNIPAELFKRWISRRVDWWFAYNDYSADIINKLGYPKHFITNTLNTVDTRSLKSALEKLNKDDLRNLKNSLGIEGDEIAIYTGNFSRIKRIDFLLISAKEIRQQVPNFHLILIGDGAKRHKVERFSDKYPWAHYVGAKQESDKVPYWAISKLLLMPGGVGLVVLDSFALGVPLVTTENRLHGPEISYVQNERNGLVVNSHGSTKSYANAVVQLLGDQDKLQSMREECLKDAPMYTNEHMVERFSKGIKSALNTLELKKH